MSDDTPTQRFPAAGDEPTQQIATGEIQEDLREEKQKNRGLLIGLIAAGALLLVAVIVLVGYYSFMMVVAFAPDLLHKPMSDDSVLSVGFPIGAGIIILSWLLTGVYSHFANGRFQDLTDEITRETLQ